MDLSRWFVHVYMRRRYHGAMLETADMFHNLADTSGMHSLVLCMLVCLNGLKL